MVETAPQPRDEDNSYRIHRRTVEAGEKLEEAWNEILVRNIFRQVFLP